MVLEGFIEFLNDCPHSCLSTINFLKGHITNSPLPSLKIFSICAGSYCKVKYNWLLLSLEWAGLIL